MQARLCQVHPSVSSQLWSAMQSSRLRLHQACGTVRSHTGYRPGWLAREDCLGNVGFTKILSSGFWDRERNWEVCSIDHQTTPQDSCRTSYNFGSESFRPPSPPTRKFAGCFPDPLWFCPQTRTVRSQKFGRARRQVEEPCTSRIFLFTPRRNSRNSPATLFRIHRLSIRREGLKYAWSTKTPYCKPKTVSSNCFTPFLKVPCICDGSWSITRTAVDRNAPSASSRITWTILSR